MEYNEKDLNQSGGLGTKTSHFKCSSPIFSVKMHLLEYLLDVGPLNTHPPSDQHWLFYEWFLRDMKTNRRRGSE